MHLCRIFRSFAAFLFLCMVLAAQPASARRTVIDASTHMTTGEYCSPVSSFTSDCQANAMGFTIQISGSSYDAFYANSNGTVSFNSIETQLAAQNSYTGTASPLTYTGPTPADSLGDYAAPIFSPYFLDGPGDPTTFIPNLGFDGELVAETSATANSFTVNWYSCANPLTCGMATFDIVENAVFDPTDGGLTNTIMSFGDTSGCPCDPLDVFTSGKAALLAQLQGSLPVYTMTLTDLADGFQVDYTYNLGALGDAGLYGFHLPGGLFEVSGPLANQTYRFDSNGQLLPAVPEPATWLTMLLGFGLAGMAMRRRRALPQPA